MTALSIPRVLARRAVLQSSVHCVPTLTSSGKQRTNNQIIHSQQRLTNAEEFRRYTSSCDLHTATDVENTEPSVDGFNTEPSEGRLHTEPGEGRLHVPVMVDEVLEHLKPRNGQVIVDMTFGSGGHTERILDAAPEARIVCLDRDPLAYDIAVTLAERHRPGQIIPLNGRFSDLPHLHHLNSVL